MTDPRRPRKTRQRAAAVPDDVWDPAIRIAAIRGERDAIGDGLSVVIRRSLRAYVARNRHLLEDASE